MTTSDLGGFVRRKRPPGPKIPATRSVMLEAIQQLATAQSDDQVRNDLSRVLQRAADVAEAVLADRDEADDGRRKQASRLQDRVTELSGLLEGGAQAAVALCAIDIGAVLVDLDVFYIKEGSRTASYDERHFRRMGKLIGANRTKYSAAEQVLKETHLRLQHPDNNEDLKIKVRSLVAAYDRSEADQS